MYVNVYTTGYQKFYWALYSTNQWRMDGNTKPERTFDECLRSMEITLARHQVFKIKLINTTQNLLPVEYLIIRKNAA